MIKKFKNSRIRTQFAIVILFSALLSYLLFHFLWLNKYPILDWIDVQFHLNDQRNDEEFWETLREEALKYDIPESEEDTDTAEKLAPFFALTDEYTGIYIYGLEDGLYRAGKYAEVMDQGAFHNFFDFGYRITGGEGEQRLDFPMEFRNGTATLLIVFYHNSRLVYPYALILTCLCVGLFLFIVLFYLQYKMKTVIALKDEVLRMASGDLTHALPERSHDEIGILSGELDRLRITLRETIQNEQESRKANQDLITTMSHDLRTPLTILNGYLEVLRLKKNPQMQEEYLERCLKKSNEIKEMTDRMFEYALVFEKTEVPELAEIPLSFLHQCLTENSDFIRLAGFDVDFSFTEEDISLSGDQTMLKRIFNNLFSNILKYGDKKQKVVITSVLKDNVFKITLSNAVKQELAGIESNHIGLKSVEKMMRLTGGQLYVTENKMNFKVSLIFHS